MKFNEARKLANQLKKFDSQISDMVTIMGVEAKNHFTANFRKQGFEDESLKRWEARKGEINGGIAKVRGRSRGVLIKTGTLRRSIQFNKRGKYKVSISTGGLPYAKLQNEGGIIYRKAHKSSKTITARVRGSAGFVNGVWTKGRSKKVQLKGASYNVKGSSFKMPKRQFIGNSGKLNRKIISKLKSKINIIFA